MSAGYATVLKRMIGKDIEIYQGVEHETILRAEIEASRKSVIRGVLKEVVEECVIIECSGVEIFINAWSIYSVMEVHPSVTLHNIYHSSDNTSRRGVKV